MSAPLWLLMDPLAAALIADGIEPDAAQEIVERAAIITFDGHTPRETAELIASGGYTPKAAP